MKPASSTLTPQELEIMKVVWQKGEATVRDVYEDLLERRKIAYTTVMTMMKVLEGKGHLKKRQDDRAYVYRPTRPEAAVVRGHGPRVRGPAVRRGRAPAVGASW